ncbi:hypothetical protein FOXYSP1_08298 [Fusarium oxysporum f. sp. phaseoli]
MSPLTEADKLTIHSVCGASRATGKSTHRSSTTT